MSVTVIDYEDIPVTTMADAYATAFNTMGYDKAYDFANKNNISALFILEKEGDISIVKTQKWYDLKL